MKIKFPYPALLILIAIIFASSCQEPKELVYRDFKNLRTEKIGFGTSTITVELVYYNPNNFGMQLKYTDLDIYINNNYLGHSTQDYQITIPKRDEFTVPIKIDVDTKSALKNALVTLINQEVTIKASGKVKLGKANVYKMFNVNYEGKQKFTLF